MAEIIDPFTQKLIGNPNVIPLEHIQIDSENFKKSFLPLILSASGWRKVFAESENEEDANPNIGEANQVLVAHMASVFADYLSSKIAATEKEIVLGMDSRPTGPEIASIMSRVFVSKGFKLKYIGVSAAPEIMAYARQSCGFAYISASHNPIGHNGVKFGLNDGGVIPAGEARFLIEEFTKACKDALAIEKAQTLIQNCPVQELTKSWNAIKIEKQKALESYAAFTKEVVSAESDIQKQDLFFDTIQNKIQLASTNGKPISIVIDFNGSARSISIDRSFFENLGISVYGLSEKVGAITHRIVPEGQSLTFCAHEIERLRKEGKTKAEKNVSIGFMPDCDGDRGNIVYWNDSLNKACILEAQEVFALCVIAELTHLVYAEKISITHKNIDGIQKAVAHPPLAISVNDPTSMRIEEIAASFGAIVARAEVGEANVVNKARELRSKGYIVRILGEGSNGGNITHPAAVRDPLNTVFALLKMLIIKDDEHKKGLFHIWCMLSGQQDKYTEDFSLTDIIKTLPAFNTTSAYETEAILTIKTNDHSILKRKFQKIFLREWDLKKEDLAKMMGIQSWVAISNNGTTETENISDFGDSNKGGLKIKFLTKTKEAIAFMWMRGSGTEPVFRILCDIKGNDPSNEKYLLNWLTKMVLEADTKI